jgi:hypothetical protein
VCFASLVSYLSDMWLSCISKIPKEELERTSMLGQLGIGTSRKSDLPSHQECTRSGQNLDQVFCSSYFVTVTQ